MGEDVSVGTNVFVTSSSIAKKCTLGDNIMKDQIFIRWFQNRIVESLSR